MSNAGVQFSPRHVAVVRFCAIECEMQQSGEASVAGMVEAWAYAVARRTRKRIQHADVLILGELVEPVKNARGYRQVPVAVGSWDNQKLHWEKIPRALTHLLGSGRALPPGEWFREYEEIHPFVDGNGRTGQILFNWLNGSLGDPVWAPNFWADPRRAAGRGA